LLTSSQERFFSNFARFHLKSAKRRLKTGGFWHFSDQNGQNLNFFLVAFPFLFNFCFFLSCHEVMRLTSPEKRRNPKLIEMLNNVLLPPSFLPSYLQPQSFKAFFSLKKVIDIQLDGCLV